LEKDSPILYRGRLPYRELSPLIIGVATLAADASGEVAESATAEA
jgi:hypothetical protein